MKASFMHSTQLVKGNISSLSDNTEELWVLCGHRCKVVSVNMVMSFFVKIGFGSRAQSKWEFGSN